MKIDDAETMAKAFPALFPYGHKDFNSCNRPTKVNLQEFLAHCYNWHDGRFATHKLWPYWAYN